MRLLHTADWHLADRLKQIDRTADIQSAVDHVAARCDEESVDVLLIAGDIFSELVTPKSLHTAISHLGRTLRAFLLRGGTIVAVAGNHDQDLYCETLRRAIQLGAPIAARVGELMPSGRLYLATRPVHFRLADPHGQLVQFVCLPYPTIARYLQDGRKAAYSDFAARNRLLESSYAGYLRQLRHELSSQLPSVLVTHVNAMPVPEKPGVFSTIGDEDVHVNNAIRPDDWSYVALGHLHRPQAVGERDHLRYSGSLERLSVDEKNQVKGTVVVDIDRSNQPATTRFVQHQATTFYDVCIKNAATDVPRLPDRYPDASRALVRCHVRYRPGKENLIEILADIARVFPRCYERTWSKIRPPNRHRSASRQAPADPLARDSNTQDNVTHVPSELSLQCMSESGASTGRLMLAYLRNRLADDPDLESLLGMAERLLEDDL